MLWPAGEACAKLREKESLLYHSGAYLLLESSNSSTSLPVGGHLGPVFPSKWEVCGFMLSFFSIYFFSIICFLAIRELKLIKA